VQIKAANFNLAGVGYQHTGQQLHRRAFASAVGAKQTEYFATLEL